MAKRSKEERQEEFISLAERLMGFPMVSYQKEWMEKALTQFAAGKPIDICICPPGTTRRHKIGCPQGEN